MSLRYNKIKNHPRTFKRLFGISVDEFGRIAKAVEPEWEKRVIKRYKRPGRNNKLSLHEQILMLLLYYRSYATQIFIGFLFGIDDSRVCRNIQRLEPILARVMAITKTRHLSQEEIEEIIIDATEQQIERPQKGQKAFYSGKKNAIQIKQKSALRFLDGLSMSLKQNQEPFMILLSIKRTSPFPKIQLH